jgi:putative hydrolase of the HAD superfamily
MIKGITFDLWDTVFIDDSDEPKRKAAGRPTKAVERRQLVHRFLQKHQTIERLLVDAVYNTADAAFRKVWHDQFVTWTVAERLDVILKGLKAELPEGERQELIRLHEEMELEFRPDFVPGVHQALHTLHGRYKIAVISDAIFSPGRCLRKLLADEDLLSCFDAFVFSDEVGHSKPEPSVFQTAWNRLGLAPHEIVHIGDREHNDILGPKRAGMHCLLCTAAIDRDSKNTQADAVFKDYRQLPEILENLNCSLTS